MANTTTERKQSAAAMTTRIAEVPCGAGSAFLHPACCGSDLSGVEYHDLTYVELLEQQIVFCDGCGERIVPVGLSLAGKAAR